MKQYKLKNIISGKVINVLAYDFHHARNKAVEQECFMYTVNNYKPFK